MHTFTSLSEPSVTANLWIEWASLIIEVLAVFIIVSAVLISTSRYLYFVVKKRSVEVERYLQYKHSLGKSLLLGLEILVAADVVRTVALAPTIGNIATLGLLVVVRTFLSWSLVVEIEGRWPWQKVQKLDSQSEKKTSNYL